MAHPGHHGNPGNPGTSIPFHDRLQQLRSAALVSRVEMAIAAGVSGTIWRDMEEGKVAPTADMYDVAIARFPSLSSYTRPLQPVGTVTRIHPAVVAEWERFAPLLAITSSLNIGVTNRARVIELIRCVMLHGFTIEEVLRVLNP